MNETRIIVCGGRHYPDRAEVFRTLDDISRQHGPLFVIEGGATGADLWAREWRRDRLIPGKTYHASWKALGSAAGPIRNHLMLTDGKPELVVAFPGGRGTRNMIRQALDAGIPVTMADQRAKA